ncbi:hypothetical protein BAUCODRAFT_61359 [Baudoinia panamericana UAMH 10762]|uniref:BTB domain-containing protein n=1 Tax=Baudoinia panamericana (strain UAMH 10762) TaxID=717646 RepID=M2MUK9_BAUPA|nr:uncharacterized protein BAUCODRAFT_61359 [Baudoinia panamericana UAMH 10762]EMD00612.1 hypothetical protein BAUCODRAFT_61359 [Baudoinia panamericana UAMH 10762]
MVSHHRIPSYQDSPSPAPSAPPAIAPRAASVTSGRSHTRRHRHARTHHGGTTPYAPQNEFPVFSYTGDVEILITSTDGRRENRYVLHRLILSQCSGFFEAGTRAEWSGQQPGAGPLTRIAEDESVTVGSSSRASSQERRPSYDQPARQRWKYVLDWEHTPEDDAPMLVRKDEASSMFGGGAPPPVRNKPPASNEHFFRSMTNFSALNLHERSQSSVPAEHGDEVLKDYDNLFRTMYQYPPILDSINIATAYSECKALLHLADMYDALEIVGSRVDHHLLRFGARLFKQIAKYPPSYLKLGYLARSRTIFTESLIHVVGQWPLAAPQLRGQIDAAVMDLIEDKVDELREQEERVEFKLWRLSLTTTRGERVTPANDYLAWLGMSLFRQWLAENTTPAPTGMKKDSSQPAPPTSASAPSPGRVYRLLGSSMPNAYLNHEELKRFLKLQPDLYTRDNLRRFERRMEEIKDLARELAKPLMRNFLELDLSILGPAGLGYLTCVRLEPSEIPWED